jgi:toxin ParE1/3/4
MIAAVLSPAARRDLLSALRWIAKDNPAAARALREGLARATERIGTHPQLGTVRPDLAGDRYRFVPLTGFPYVIVYTADRHPPLIVRILHAARDLPDLLRGS